MEFDILDLALSGYKLLWFYCSHYISSLIWYSSTDLTLLICCQRSDPSWLTCAWRLYRTLWDSLLDLAGMELSSFVAAHTFVTKTVLLMHQCCRCCWAVLGQSQGFLFFWLCLEVGKGLREDHLGQLTWTDQWNLQYHVLIMSCLARKPQAEEKEGCGVGFQGGCCLEAGWTLDCLWCVVSDLFYLLVCLFATHTSSPVELPLYWPTTFLILPFLFFYHLSCKEGQGAERAAVWVLGCWLGSIHHSYFMWLTCRLSSILCCE